MESLWESTLSVGDYVRLENLPFSQKHFNDESLREYFMPAEGRIFSLSYDKIILVADNGEKVVFKPIPPLSGDVLFDYLPNSNEGEKI